MAKFIFFVELVNLGVSQEWVIGFFLSVGIFVLHFHPSLDSCDCRTFNSRIRSRYVCTKLVLRLQKLTVHIECSVWYFVKNPEFRKYHWLQNAQCISDISRRASKLSYMESQIAWPLVGQSRRREIVKWHARARHVGRRVICHKTSQKKLISPFAIFKKNNHWPFISGYICSWPPTFNLPTPNFRGVRIWTPFRGR